MARHKDPRIDVVSSRRAFSGRVFDVLEESIRLPSGLRQDLALVQHPGAVAIAALDAEGRLLLVRQYRHAVGKWMVEIPAGRLEAGEAPLRAAQRELEEETAHRASKWEQISDFWVAPGFCSENIILFLARDLTLAGDDSLEPDADEEIEVLRSFPADLLSSSKDAKTLLAASWLLQHGKDLS